MCASALRQVPEKAVCPYRNREDGDERLRAAGKGGHPQVCLPPLLKEIGLTSCRDAFIYEYVGDVVSNPSFLKRMREYGEEGIKHFYFMMLQKDEVRSDQLGREPLLK